MFERAATVDPRNPVPLINLFWTELNWRRDPKAAELAARRLVALDPGSSAFAHLAAWSLVARCRFAEAEQAMHHVLSMDPNHRIAQPNLAHLLFRRGQAGEAASLYRRVLDQESHHPDPHSGTSLDLALALLALGDRAGAYRLLDGAERDLARRDGNPPADPAARLELAELEAARNRAERAEALVKSAVGASPGDPSILFQAAGVYALLGRRDEAVDQLESALSGGYWDKYFALVDPVFGSIREEPRFKNLFPGCEDSGH